MIFSLLKIITLFGLARIEAKEPELPLCPANIQYFPQNLPMHCRMPAVSRTSGKSKEMLPLPVPGFPGPMPGALPGMVPGPMPGMAPGPMPGMMPGAMPMPMAPMPQLPSQKLPVVVMPFYSPENNNDLHHSIRHKKHRLGVKRRPKHFYQSDEDASDANQSSDDSSSSSSEHGLWKGGRRSNRHRSKRRRHQSKDLLTPVLQYVTKDGYVIFEKKITKGEAKNWLGNKNEQRNNQESKIRNDDPSDFREPRDDNLDIKFSLRDDENAEIKTENYPRLAVHKKNVKRKHTEKKVPE